jgi:hypothetical protein
MQDLPAVHFAPSTSWLFKRSPPVHNPPQGGIATCKSGKNSGCILTDNQLQERQQKAIEKKTITYLMATTLLLSIHHVATTQPGRAPLLAHMCLANADTHLCSHNSNDIWNISMLSKNWRLQPDLSSAPTVFQWPSGCVLLNMKCAL